MESPAAWAMRLVVISSMGVEASSSEAARKTRWTVSWLRSWTGLRRAEEL